MISREFVDELLKKTDITELVAPFTQLSSKGSQLCGKCPFCRRPLFHISKEKQIYKCFGCKEGGNAVRFIMQIKKLPFPDAVKLLAQKLQIKMPGEDT